MDFWFWLWLLTAIFAIGEIFHNPRPWDKTPGIFKWFLRVIGDMFWIFIILAVIKGFILLINA